MPRDGWPGERPPQGVQTGPTTSPVWQVVFIGQLATPASVTGGAPPSAPASTVGATPASAGVQTDRQTPGIPWFWAVTGTGIVHAVRHRDFGEPLIPSEFLDREELAHQPTASLVKPMEPGPVTPPAATMSVSSRA